MDIKKYCRVIYFGVFILVETVSAVAGAAAAASTFSGS